ncbi:MAG: GreA/GreB family elongation factor [Rhizobacter sp.]|jgi:regulator of nucleoside diphosphate kinase|nr:GreA/GreB family elongation factor [Burkholderiaceae bacterium]MCO5122216.1 GreA/GreB family elongation factor [Rhizobacter sp.]
MEVLALERTLSELDHVRLTNLVHRHKCGRSTFSSALPIEQVLDAADIVHWREVPPDVVTMLSRVELKDPQTGATSRLTLCYPEDADPAVGFVSVLSPLGWSLLGQKVGTTVHWPTPSGAARAAEILGILFQPESSGDFAM